MSPTAERAAPRATAEVDAAAIAANCGVVRSSVGDGVELCAVVKADAYGHGCERVAAAALEGGATRFAVSTAGEAELLRSRFPRVPVLAMGALAAEEVDLALACGAELGCWGRDSLELIRARAAVAGARARIHAKFDSGMGRLGTADVGELLDVARACDRDPNLELTGVWTHFATADDFGSSFFAQQLGRFRAAVGAVRADFPGVLVHAANSAATFRSAAAHFDMVRCGVAVYGLDPFQRDPRKLGLQPALSLRSQLAQVKRLAPGDTAGYGRWWRARTATSVGLVPIGYGDGVRRGLSGRAEVLIGGSRVPVVGRISMDSLTVDLGPDPCATVGDPVVIVGAQGAERILVEELARNLATINYEVTCGISKRVPRVPAL